MKKIFICLFAVAALVVTGCSNKSAAESDAQSVVNELQQKLESNDSQGFNAIVSDAQKTLKGLIEDGKVEEAKAYAEQLKDFVTENEETIKNVAGENDAVNSIVDAIKAIPTGLSGSAAEVKENLENAASNVSSDVKEAFEELKDEALAERDKYKDQAKEAAEQAVQDAKDKANAAVEDAKTKANAAVEDAKQKANDAANKAVEDAKTKASDAANKAVDDAANKLKNAFKK